VGRGDGRRPRGLCIEETITERPPRRWPPESNDRRLLTVTGPAALTSADISALLTEITGAPGRVVQVSPEALSKGLVGAGLPQPVAELLTAFDVNTKLGRASQVSGDVEHLTGRPPQSLRDFLSSRYAPALN
jgi:NAD(P)H dehydrogenase (quinone)